MDETIPNRDTLLKDHIMASYIELCTISSKLLGQVRGNTTGSKYHTFVEFEEQMFKIYNLSCVFSLGTNIKKTMRDWINAKRKNPPSNKFMLKSVDLFESFSHELVIRKIIEV